MQFKETSLSLPTMLQGWNPYDFDLAKALKSLQLMRLPPRSPSDVITVSRTKGMKGQEPVAWGRMSCDLLTIKPASKYPGTNSSAETKKNWECLSCCFSVAFCSQRFVVSVGSWNMGSHRHQKLHPDERHLQKKMLSGRTPNSSLHKWFFHMAQWCSVKLTLPESSRKSKVWLEAAGKHS